MQTAQKHVEEIIGGLFGTGGGITVMTITQPGFEFIMTVFTAFVCGAAGALGGYLVKRFTKKKEG